MLIDFRLFLYDSMEKVLFKADFFFMTEMRRQTLAHNLNTVYIICSRTKCDSAMHSNLKTLEMKRVYISGVYISQLIRFARVSRHVADFNARNKSLTAKLLQQGYWYHKLRKTFSKFYRRHYELASKFNVGLKPLLHQGLS